MNLDQPVDEKSSHALGDLVTLHVVCSYGLLHLWKQTVTLHKETQGERRVCLIEAINYLQDVEIVVDIFDVV